MARSLQLQVILDAVDRATGPMRNIAKGSAGAGAAIRQTRDHLRDLQDQQKRITAFQDMARQANDTRGALSLKRKELSALTAQMSASENPAKRLVQQQQRAQREVDKLSTRYREQTQRGKELRKELPAKAAGIKNLGDHQSDLARRVEAANRVLGQQQEALRRLGAADVTGRYRTMSTEVGRLARRTLVMGGAAAGGIFAIANSTATLGDQVAKAADKLGLGIDVFQELRYAGERGGMANELMDKTLLNFTRRIAFAARGTGAAVKAYDELGLSAEALSQMTPDQALGVVADRLEQIQDHNERLGYASQIFDNTGGAAMLNVLKGGAEGLKELRNQAHLTGYVLSEQAARDAEVFNDSLLDAQLGMKGMKNIIGAELMPSITELMQSFSGWMIENRHRVQEFAQVFGARMKSAVPIIIDMAKGAAQFFTTFARGVQTIAGWVGGFQNLAIIMGVLFSLKAITSVLAFVFAIFKAGSAILMLSKTLGIAAGAAKLFGLTLMGTPIGWFMAAIAALAAGVYLIYRNWDGISGWFAQRWQAIKDTLSGVISLFTTQLPDQFRELGHAMIAGLIGGILGKATALRDALTGAAGNAVSGFKNLLGINSPSKVFAEFGVNTMEGYQQGIQRAEAKPLREISGIAKRIQQAGAGLLLGTLSTVAGALPNSMGVDARVSSASFDTRGPLSSAAGSGGLTIEGGIHISVQAQPGMDEQALARHIATEVQRALANAHHQASARQRSALYDTD
ncbi:MAG: hypothetical protein Q8K97_12435 [Pseudohongiella sp.]|nr:hypothetical protein [Pseudohongiella sp.]